MVIQGVTYLSDFEAKKAIMETCLEVETSFSGREFVSM